jgi:hypothetical protein
MVEWMGLRATLDQGRLSVRFRFFGLWISQAAGVCALPHITLLKSRRGTPSSGAIGTRQCPPGFSAKWGAPSSLFDSRAYLLPTALPRWQFEAAPIPRTLFTGAACANLGASEGPQRTKVQRAPFADRLRSANSGRSSSSSIAVTR